MYITIEQKKKKKVKPILQFFKFGSSSFSSNYWAQSLLIIEIMKMGMEVNMHMMIMMGKVRRETWSLWLVLLT